MINKLSDDILLEIFDLYRIAVVESWDHSWTWHTLVHTCRRWRHIIFASPKRLDLRLLCTYGTPVRRILHCWPPTLPIIINYWDSVEFMHPAPEDEDNIIAALEQADRVSRVEVVLSRSQLVKLVAVMQGPFPSLTYLRLRSVDETAPVLPRGLLGGSASTLRDISLDGIPFPALPRLLLSAHDLVSLRLWRIPDSGYISPQAIITCLSTLVRLEWLAIGFRSPISASHRNRPPTPSTRVILPSLTQFNFQGVSEYLEDLSARIDVPQLEHAGITFLNQLIFDIPQLSLFAHRTNVLRFSTRANMYSGPDGVLFSLYYPGATDPYESFSLRVLSKELDW